MPTNVTPQYQKAELAFRRAKTAAERLSCLELMLQLVPKHKGSEKLQADLKSRLKQTRQEIAEAADAGRRGAAVAHIPRQGDAQVLIVGGPNAGKSRILRELTSAQPEVAEFPFTTVAPFPGMLSFEDLSMQLVDTPPITESWFEPGLIDLARTADLVLLAIDGTSATAAEDEAAVIAQFARRHTWLARAHGFADGDFSQIHVKTLRVVTRGQADTASVLVESERFETLAVDLEDPADRTRLAQAIVGALELIRVYTRAPKSSVEDATPFVLPAGSTVEDVARKIHRDLVDRVRSAKIWSAGAVDPVTVGKQHVLADRDVIELRTAN